MSKNCATSTHGLCSSKPNITIVGCGMAGIATAIALRKNLRYENFVIYERADTIGGTWRDNTYPGCGSDIPCHWYSFSQEPNPDWKSYYANQPEIREYLEGVFKKHNLQKYLVNSTNVEYARWDNELKGYELTLVNTKTGEKTSAFTEILISAIGGFISPVHPKDLFGKDVFTGHIWHSSRWNHEVSLSGKSVGVIGNGCSAAQIVPAISQDNTVKVLNFCRTPQWYIKKSQYNYPDSIKWVFRNIPFMLRWYRNYISIRFDFDYLGMSKRFPLILHGLRRYTEYFIKKRAPKEFHEALIPQYTPGCRRIIIDPGYLKCLGQNNVDLCWDAIDQIADIGILLKSGKLIELDIIILATGFSMENPGLRVSGNDGLAMADYFATKDGPYAYLGTSVPNFPNFCLLFGPNVATGHASVIFAVETQIEYSLKLIKPVIDGLVKSFDVREDITDKYNEHIRDLQKYSVTQDCQSFYKSANGRNFAIFPGTMTYFYWLACQVRWDNYIVTGGKQWEIKRKYQGRRRKLAVSLSIVVLALALAVGMYSGGLERPYVPLREHL